MRAGKRLAFDFDGVDREQYNAVSARLGLDPESEEATGPCSRTSARERRSRQLGLRGWETPSVQEQCKHERLE